MIALKALILGYLRDQRGAYGLITAITFGFLMLAVHVGVDALRVQNAGTSAEQLVDIACQKIALADPALYPTAAALKTAVEQQMTTRRIAGTNVADGALTIEPGAEDPNFVAPLKTDSTNADLRRYNFTVKYDGSVRGLNRDIAQNGAADVKLAKRCKPVCPGMTNVIYSNPIAVGHWMDRGTLKVGQMINPDKSVAENFSLVDYDGDYSNPARSGDRLVMTIINANGHIRLRTILDPGYSFYVDGNNYRSPGEPGGRGVNRLVVADDDLFFIQLLNADGSLPGMCGLVIPVPPCIGSGCNPPPPPPPPPCSGTACGGSIPPTSSARNPCVYSTALPNKWESYTFVALPYLNVPHSVFQFPQTDQPGSLVVKTIMFGGKTVVTNVKLAPFYVPNTDIAPTISIGPNIIQNQTREMVSSYGFAYFMNKTFTRKYIDFYLVHISGILRSYWFDPATGRCLETRSPIVFDTKDLGEIITTRSGNAPAINTELLFDYFSNGEKPQVEWPIGDGQAWLVDNRDGRAAVDMTGKRLFGDMQGHENGYVKLRELDSSGTGVLTGKDLDGLVLWFDNGNATVEDGELRSMADLGITAIDTRADWQMLDDGRAVLRSTAVMNGRTIMTEDITVLVSTPAIRLAESIPEWDQK